MISGFFIRRPKFALVISIFIVLAGVLSFNSVPVTQFPEITPPVVQVTANYPGASAEVLEAAVAVPLEQEINGVDRMLYLRSTSANNGRLTINVSFEVGTDPNIAQVNVQNRVALAESRLPEEVVRRGVSVRKQSTSILLFGQFFSPDGSRDELFISNYASINIRDQLLRVPDVGGIQLFGGRDYAMRVWLDPDRMTGLSLTTNDVANAIREQNIQVAAGQVGQAPSNPNQQFKYTIQTQGRLSTVDEFSDIIVRANTDGSVTRIDDFARLELGAENYDTWGRLNGAPTVVMAVYLQPGGNALEVSQAIRDVLAELEQSFPPGLAWTIVYDTTRFVEASVTELIKTLALAIALVVLVVYIFLGDWRSTIIPLATIPVSLIGTIAVMNLLGYSLNTITLFGLILAVGIVVDDAIVVIENVQRWLSQGLSGSEATLRAMREVTGPIIATTLVLLAVFLPVGFLPGLTGKLYEQFAVTMSVAVVLSSINALTLSPALAAGLARPAVNRWFALRWFENGFNRLNQAYNTAVSITVRRLALVSLLFIAIVSAAYAGFVRLPSAFFPVEDQGYFFVHIQLPEGAAPPRTARVMDQVNSLLQETPGVSDTVQIGGFNIVSSAISSNAGLTAVVLDPWEQRDHNQHVSNIVGGLYGKLAAIPEAVVFPIIPPSVRGLGNVGGFEFQLQDAAQRNVRDFAGILGAFVIAANQAPELQGVFSTFQADVPQIYADVDRRKARTLGVPLSEIYSNMQAQLGSLYVNDFNRFGRVYRVMLQAEQEYRDDPTDIFRFRARSNSGEMVPLGTLVTLEPTLGPDTVSRYNLLRAATINGNAAPGFSSGDAIQAMQRVAAESLPPGMSYEWGGVSLQEIQSSGQTIIILGLALLFVFLFLVAQYESWSAPIAVMLAVPIAAAGAVAALYTFQLYNNIYAQIGLVMLIGLASKNAILIVEFALHERRQGTSLQSAAIKAANLRFRAVMMTAISFILGVLPLVLATGAGAEGRNSLGTPVFGGMLAGAAIGTLLTPAFFVLVQKLAGKREQSLPTTDSVGS